MSKASAGGVSKGRLWSRSNAAALGPSGETLYERTKRGFVAISRRRAEKGRLARTSAFLSETTVACSPGYPFAFSTALWRSTIQRATAPAIDFWIAPGGTTV